jgi:anti-sigma factor RsiW
MLCEDTRELVTGFVDNELSTQERALLEGHLEDCSKCLDAVSRERQMKARTHEAGQRITAPPELHAALDRQYGIRGEGWWGAVLSWRRISLRPLPAMALLILIVVPVAFLVMESQQAISLETLQTHEAAVSGTIPYAESDSPQWVAQELSQAVGSRFAPPTYDLGKFGLHTVGGFRQQVEGRDVLVTVYKGSANPLTCHMFLGDESDIPAGARLVSDPLDDRKYFAFSEGTVNGVLQRYGDEVCVLVSEMPMDDLIRIARSVHHVNHS